MQLRTRIVDGHNAFHTLEVTRDIHKHAEVERGTIGNLNETHREDLLVEAELADEILGVAVHEDDVLVHFGFALGDFRFEVGDLNVDPVAFEEVKMMHLVEMLGEMQDGIGPGTSVHGTFELAKLALVFVLVAFRLGQVHLAAEPESRKCKALEFIGSHILEGK